MKDKQDVTLGIFRFEEVKIWTVYLFNGKNLNPLKRSSSAIT